MLVIYQRLCANFYSRKRFLEKASWQARLDVIGSLANLSIRVLNQDPVSSKATLLLSALSDFIFRYYPLDRLDDEQTLSASRIMLGCWVGGSNEASSSDVMEGWVNDAFKTHPKVIIAAISNLLGTLAGLDAVRLVKLTVLAAPAELASMTAPHIIPLFLSVSRVSRYRKEVLV